VGRLIAPAPSTSIAGGCWKRLIAHLQTRPGRWALVTKDADVALVTSSGAPGGLKKAGVEIIRRATGDRGPYETLTALAAGLSDQPAGVSSSIASRTS
jgi:hypothetical protein